MREHDPDKRQSVVVKGGQGEFSLVVRMPGPGHPHLGFYPTPSGNAFGGVYFGQGESVLRERRWK